MRPKLQPRAKRYVILKPDRTQMALVSRASEAAAINAFLAPYSRSRGLVTWEEFYDRGYRVGVVYHETAVTMVKE